MRVSPSVLLGVGGLVLSLAAVPLTAEARHNDEALAFVAGAVVGHLVTGHDQVYRPTHRRSHHKPVIRHFRGHPGLGHHKFHRRVERGYWKHHHKHDHRRYERRHHRDHERWDRRRGRPDA